MKSKGMKNIEGLTYKEEKVRNTREGRTGEEEDVLIQMR